MLQTTITVAYVNPSTDPKKSPSIKDTSGAYYYVQAADLGRFQKDGTYTIDYEQKPKKDGNGFWNTIKNVHGANGNGAAPPPAVQHRGTTPIASPQQASPSPNGAARYGSTDDKTAERIFVCGALNAAIGNGMIDLESPAAIDNAVNALRRSWARTFGSNAPVPRVADTISTGRGPIPADGDEIPF